MDYTLQLKGRDWGNSLAVQWLGLHASTAGGMRSIPGQGTKILQAVRCGQKKKKKRLGLQCPTFQ